VVILRSKSPNRNYRFWDPNWQTRRPWFWGQTKKPALTISLCKSYTASPKLLMVWPSSIRPVLDHPWSTAPCLLLLPRPSSLSTMSYLPPTHHETSKHDSPHKIDSSRTIKMSWIWIQTIACQWLITIKSKYWPLTDFWESGCCSLVSYMLENAICVTAWECYMLENSCNLCYCWSIEASS
jgi:hypothetical protein